MANFDAPWADTDLAAHLAPALIGRRQSPASPRTVALGNSITAAGDGTSDAAFTDSIQHLVSALSGGRVELVHNGGVSGQTTTQILARFDADVTPFTPGIVLMATVATNDYSGGAYTPVSLSASMANVRALVARCYAAGAVPVLTTMTPVAGASAAQNAYMMAHNGWLKAYCASEGILCVDLWAALVSPTGNGWLTVDHTVDGTHPTRLGQFAIANAIVAAIPSSFPAIDRREATSGDTTNLIGNPLFATGTSGIGTGWADSGASTAGSRAYTLIANPSGPGQLQRVTLSETGAKQATLNTSVTIPSTAYTAGDILGVYAECTMNATAPAAGQSLQASLTAQAWNGGSALNTVAASEGIGIAAGATAGVNSLTRTMIGRRITAQPGMNALVVTLTVQTAYQSGATGGNGTVDWGRIRVVNLTRLGLA